MRSDNKYFQLCAPSDEDRALWTSFREGEVRLGQEVHFCGEDEDSWKNRKFHILGICEDIGPRANGGFGGADKAFPAFINRFLSVQSNRFLDGNDIAIHGVITPMETSVGLSLKELVADLDEVVAEWTETIVASGGIPVVIGGGHNNAYGLIKGTSNALSKPLAVVNLDPHADVRELEGRHSGNPFSYAWKEGYLKTYTVLGLHQSYNNAFVLNQLDKMQAKTAFFEDWIDEPGCFYSDISTTSKELSEESAVGIELDLDSIANMPSSAYTSSGISVEQARFYIRKMAALKGVRYLHLPEAAPKTEQDEIIVGKALTYLVTDFIKCHGKTRGI